MIKKIVSGGQTGVDRAILDVARGKGIPHGGWCPKGRGAEDGVIPGVYQLKETESEDVNVRTRKNIEDSDGTVVFVPSLPLSIQDGTRLTITHAQALAKPLFIVDLSNLDDVDNNFNLWVKGHTISVLNVGGPRESSSPGVYDKVFTLFTRMLRVPTYEEKETSLAKLMMCFMNRRRLSQLILPKLVITPIQKGKLLHK